MKKGPTVTCTPSFMGLAQTIPDLIHAIFSLLPKQQFLPQRLLNSHIRRIIDKSLINRDAAQQIGQFQIGDQASEQALFLAQQREIESLVRNKNRILNTPRYKTQVVRPAPELIVAFEQLEILPKDCSLFSLYQRHIVLNEINMQMIFNSRDNNLLTDMFLVDKVVDLSYLFLTTLPSDFFDLFIDKSFYGVVLELNVSHNCLKSLPRCVRLFENLKVLDVSGNELGALPDTISHWRELKIKQDNPQSTRLEREFRHLRISSS